MRPLLGVIAAATLLPAGAAQASGTIERSGSTLTWQGTGASDTITMRATASSIIFPIRLPRVTFHFESPTTITVDPATAPGCSASATEVTCAGTDGGVAIERVQALGEGGTDTLTWTNRASGRFPVICIECRSFPVSFDGGSGTDTLTGSPLDDTLNGGTEGDEIDGGGGDDSIGGQAGADVISGGSGTDAIAGDDGGDRISGDAGADSLSGGDGDDTISGGPEPDAGVNGGPGTGDEIRYDEPGRTGGVVVDLSTSAGSDGGPGETEDAVGFERVVGTASDDELSGDLQGNMLDARGGDDRLDGAAGDDIALGGEGADTIAGDFGSDTMDGGPGIDTGDWRARTDELRIAVGDVTPTDGGLADVSGGRLDTVAGLERLLGGSADDELSSSEPGPLELVGGRGDDTLLGTDRDDRFEGGPGADAIDGRAGVDSASYAEPERTEGVQVTLSAGVADDGSAFDASPTGLRDNLGAIENVLGSALADRLVGDAAPNRLVGAGGDDVLAGMGGTDAMEGGAGSDTASYAERSAGDSVTVTLDGSPTAGAPGENDAIAADVENAVGGAGPDVLTGNDLPNALDGGDGADQIAGLGGIDALRAGPGDDLVLAVDGNAEPLECGDGRDTAEADAADQLSSCEVARISNLLVDADKDGVPAGVGRDCDDANPAIRPGLPEVPGNAVDEDCDGAANPFPVIGATITSFFSVGGDRTRVTELTVRRLPAGSRAVLTCTPPKVRRHRRACGFARVSRSFAAPRATLKLVKRFKRRALPPGTVIELRVTAPAMIGKLLRFTTRRGSRTPSKRSRCLVPGAPRASACP